MMENKKEGVCLPYGNLITKILEDTRCNFGDEVFMDETTKIGKLVLLLMKFLMITFSFKWEEKKRKYLRSTHRVRQLELLLTTHN